MSRKQLKKRLAELRDDADKTNTYGSPWGSSATKAELYDIEHEIESIERLLASKKPKNVDAQLDEIYDSIDALMKLGAWDFLDDLFLYWEGKAWRTKVDILLGYATASLPGKSKLPHRKLFMDACLKFHPDKKLWKGLE